MIPMEGSIRDGSDPSQSHFIDELNAFASQHKAQRWRGTFAEFLEQILPNSPAALIRSSHQYIYDMLLWYRQAPSLHAASEITTPTGATSLFTNELFGIDSALDRVIDYFKAAAAGSDVGRRLLLLLGPPSGGKSTMVILLKRGLEEYTATPTKAHSTHWTDHPCTSRRCNLVPTSLRASFARPTGSRSRAN